MLQPDFGTTLVIGAIGMAQIFVAGISLIHFTGAVLIASIASFLLVFFSDYRKQRFMTFLNSLRDPLGKSFGADTSYHIRQILFALGSGGFWGRTMLFSKHPYSNIR